MGTIYELCSKCCNEGSGSIEIINSYNTQDRVRLNNISKMSEALGRQSYKNWKFIHECDLPSSEKGDSTVYAFTLVIYI